MRNKGFTLLEILFAIAIITIAITIVTFSFSKLNSQQALDKSADLVVSTLNEARSLTLSSKGDSQYGVHLEASQVVLFVGSTYSSSAPTNVVTSINSLVGIKNITLVGGGADIIFKRLTGGTDQTGTLEVFLIANTGSFHTITISGTGVVELD